MAQNLGTGVSYVYEEEGYNFDTVVFQKGKPPLDSEMNLCQQLQSIISKRQTQGSPSGWLSLYPAYTSRTLTDSFYTQDPTDSKPEYALVNGHVVYVTNTQTQTENTNLIELGDPPSTGNVINGVFLEVWRALLDPDTSTNKPDPATIIDALANVFMYDNNNGWIGGDNGLLLKTENGGQTWAVQSIDTSRRLNGVYFITSTIGWTVGNDGVLARSSSGGERWTILETNITENLNSIYAASQLIAWAVGDSGTILKTTNGVTFLSQVSGVTANLNKVHFYDTLTGWAVGDSETI